MKTVIYLFVGAAMLVATPALAVSGTGNLAVTATVVSSCAITSADTLAFGSVSSTGANHDSTGTVRLTCTNTTPWVLSANNGANASGVQNRMTDGTNYLSYAIYSDTGRTALFPTSAGTPGSGPASGTGTGSDQPTTVYGRIPSTAILPAPGAYTDTVQLTITY